ncbi:hypothetical protein D3C86_1626720 [compost metagenome]
MEICHCFQSESFLFRFCILKHYRTVFVISIRNRNRRIFQLVKESFLCVDVILKRLVIVQMVVRDIRKTCDFEMQSFGSVLRNSVGAYFHKSIFTTDFDSFRQHLI